jgi:hypothetical protein
MARPAGYFEQVFKDAVQFDFLTIFPVHTAAHLISVYQIQNLPRSI